MSNIIHTSAGNVFAPGLKGRQQNQTARIQAGAADGTLNNTERLYVATERAEMRQDLRAAKADDGYVDFSERKTAHQQLNGISRDIYRFRNNG